MYTIPAFADGGAGSEMRRAGDFSYNPSGTGGSSSTQNQYMGFPAMTTAPGAVPPSGSSPFFPYGPQALNPPGGVGSSYNLPSGARTGPTLDPAFTQALTQFLSSQMGKGATPFDLSAFLPTTGKASGPGQVSAPLTPELQQLMQFLQTGQGGSPSEQSLGALASTGLPIDQTPAWQAMIASEQRNIGENANQLKEQFAGFGDLSSSDFGKSISDFYTQTALGQNAQLTAATAAAQEAAKGRQLAASTDLTQLGTQMGEFGQQLDQSSIDRLLQEFIRTSPEYSPLLGEEFSLGTAFPPIYGKSGFGASFANAFGGGLGGGLAKLITG